MSADQLFKIAMAFTDAYAAAELRRAGPQTTDDQVGDAAWWEDLAAGKREELRAALGEAVRTTTYAEPDDELPVCTRDGHSVEIRADFDDGRRHIRVRYTPAQAVMAGAAMIAYAAVADDLASRALAELLLAFPPNTRSAAPRGAHGNAARPVAPMRAGGHSRPA